MSGGGGDKLFKPKITILIGLCKNQRENYCCGYRNSIFNLKLNLMMLFLSTFYMFILRATKGGEKT
jgi:hypothetical protein